MKVKFYFTPLAGMEIKHGVVSYLEISKQQWYQPIYSQPGIYFLFDEDQLVYIGQSVNLYNRVLRHRREELIDFNNVSFFIPDEGFLKKHNVSLKHFINAAERKLIDAWQPKENSLLYNRWASND